MITVNPFPARPSFDALFDYILDFARKMPELCREKKTCYYRSGDNACFVGALLTDVQAHHVQAYGAWGHSWGKGAYVSVPKWMTRGVEELTLRQIQVIHDEAKDLSTAIRELEDRRASLKKLYETGE